MTITLDLPVDEEQRLRQQAEMAGKDMSAYVQDVVRSVIISHPPPLTDDEWEALLHELADTAPPDAPLLSDYAVSREGIYAERIDRILGYDAVDPGQI